MFFIISELRNMLFFKCLSASSYCFALVVAFFFNCDFSEKPSKDIDWKVHFELYSTKPAKKLLVFLHGTYENGYTYMEELKWLHHQLPDWHFMAPHGAEPADDALARGVGWDPKADGNEKRQFLSLACVEHLIKTGNQQPPLSVETLKALMQKEKPALEQMSKELEQKSQPIMEMIRKKQKELNLTNKDTIVAGFSQGAMLGLYLTLTQKEPFCVMVSFSGLLIEPKVYKNNATPIYFIHGNDDKVIPVRTIEIGAEQLSNKGINVIKVKFDGGHFPSFSSAVESIFVPN